MAEDGAKSKSIFDNIPSLPPDETTQLANLFRECLSPQKVHLGFGTYRDDAGNPWLLPVVRSTEQLLSHDLTLNHDYLPLAGLPDFRTAAVKLLLGANHKVVVERRAEGFQTLGGTGALRLAAKFLKNLLALDVIYVSIPTRDSHKEILKASGFGQIRGYRYWDREKRCLDFVGLKQDLLTASAHSVVVLQAGGHNPTGVDPTPDQWKEICVICQEKSLIVLMDCAYQGLATGQLDTDAWVVRYFAEQNLDMFVAQSFSKNFGLYSERVGNLTVVSQDADKLQDVRCQMEAQIRTLGSNGSGHGARIVTTVLNNKTYFDQWRHQLAEMVQRMKTMRAGLVDQLKILGTPGSWEHILGQVGIFSYLALTERQVMYMHSKFVFLPSSGRMNVACLTYANLAYVAKVIDEAVRVYPVLSLTDEAGEPLPVPKKYFLEFAKQKLGEIDYNFIRTSVIVDGLMVRKDGAVVEEKSVESFIKVQLAGSASTSTLDHDFSAEIQVEEIMTPPEAEEHESPDNQSIVNQEVQEVLSTSTQPGTQRTSAKTYKTRSAQTLEADDLKDLYQPKSIPARFEGTMLTPVYFDGLLLTPEKLDTLLFELAKKGDHSIPVKLQGAMLTAAFKSLAENLALGVGAEPVRVKFQGRLKGLTGMDNDQGFPVAFEGSMKPKKSHSQK